MLIRGDKRVASTGYNRAPAGLDIVESCVRDLSEDNPGNIKKHIKTLKRGVARIEEAG